MPRCPTPWSEIAPLLTGRVIAKYEQKLTRGDPNHCWLWRGQVNQYGYGMFYVSGRRTGVLATRISYYLTYGTIKDDEFVCHLCDNPACVNPFHLWLGTHKQNLQDMWKKGRGVSWNRGLKTGPRKKRAS